MHMHMYATILTVQYEYMSITAAMSRSDALDRHPRVAEALRRRRRCGQERQRLADVGALPAVLGGWRCWEDGDGRWYEPCG